MKLFKILFIAVPDAPCAFQLYDYALDGEDAIRRTRALCKEKGIEIMEFTKISLVVSQDLIGKLMHEPL
jgi:hypothetical protein